MQLPALRRLFACVATCLVTSFGFAEAPLALPVTSDPLDLKPGKFIFSLLPSSLSRTPQLNMTVMCRLTPYGRTLPQATKENPLYFISHDGGYQGRGQPMGGSHLPDADYLNRILERSLAGNGYLPARENQSPALVLVYHWGAHHSILRPQNDFPSEFYFLNYEQTLREQLERARLIVGNGFAVMARDQMEFGFPVMDSLTRGKALTSQRRLVWRARLTVGARGVAMDEAAPLLVLTASTVFGRDSGAPQVVMRKLRRGQVKLAPLEVLESGSRKLSLQNGL